MQKRHLTLSTADKHYLENLLVKGTLTARLYKRATALLELHRGKSYGVVAQTLGVTYQTVSGWCKKYHQEGIASLQDKPRSGRSVEIDGTQRAKITALACSQPPQGHGQWSLRLLADKAIELAFVEDISHEQVRKILKKTNSNRI